MRGFVLSDLKDIQGEIMKRRVSFLLMLVLALALALALSSCGECEHLNTETREEITASGNCKVADKLDEVTVCKDCGEELLRISKNGEIGEHVAGEPVYENFDVLDCKEGGTCDEVVYCSVAKCGVEISRKTGVEVKAATEHTLKTRDIYSADHKTKTTLTYCTVCAHQELSQPVAASISTAHEYQPKASGTCKYCYDVLGNSNFEYEDNGDGTYTLKGVKGSAPQALFIGHYNGKPVTHIAENAFAGQTTIRAVTFGDCVKFVGADAFSGCTGIESVFTYNLQNWSKINFANAAANPLTSPKAIFRPNAIAIDSSKTFSTKGFEEIGTYAFAGLKANSIYISADTTKIGEGAFAGCSSLLNVHFENVPLYRTLGESVFADCENIRGVYAASIEKWVLNSFDNAKANPLYYADALYFGDKKFDSDTLDLDGIVMVPSYSLVSLEITTLNVPKELIFIGDGAFSGCKKLASVVLENGSQLSSVANSVFAGCSSLASINLPASVTLIGERAFEGCSALKSVPLSDGVEYIGSYAFKGCTALTSVKLPSGLIMLSKGVFENCSALSGVEFGAALGFIEEAAFKNCKSLANPEFTSNIEMIGKEAFYGCTSLTKINLADNIDKLVIINDAAFAGCVNVEEILVSNSVVSIGLGAFEGCTSLETISLPFVGKGIVAVESNFGYIFGATNVMGKDEDDNDVLVSLPDNRAYVPYSLANIIITGNIESIAADAFKDCEGIVTIKLPATVKKIGKNAFEGCTGLDAVYVSSLDKWTKIEFANYLSNPLALANTLYIEDEAAEVTVITLSSDVAPYAFYGAAEIFYGKNKVTAFVLNGVNKIGNDAFHGCLALESITISDSLNSVGARAFFGCESLKEVKIADLTSWCAVSFADVFANPLYCTEKLYVSGSATAEITVSSNVSAYAFAGCEFLTKITFTDAVNKISDGAFYGCTGLKSLTLSKVTEIGNGAFEACSALETVSLGQTAKIGARAFANCVAIKDTLTIPNTTTEISSEAFLNCAKITKITLGSSVKTIGACAFYSCKALEELNIPASVESIGASAFGEVSLAKVTFANASGWTVNGKAIDSALLTDADAELAVQKAAAKLNELSAYEWTRS